LKSQLDEKREDLVLIDTALREDLSEKHLPSAQNACVFDVAFHDRAAALDGIQSGLIARAAGHGPQRQRWVVVYGSSERTPA